MNRKRSVESFTDRWAMTGLLFAAPAFLIMLIFKFIPMLLNIGYAFTNYTGVKPTFKFVGFKNFTTIFNDSSFWLIMRNTLVLTVIFVVGINVLSIIISAALLSVKKLFGNFFKSLIYLPCLLAMVVVGFVWRLIYDYNNGLINKALVTLGLSGLRQDWLGEPNLVMTSVGVAIIWFALGYYVIIYYAGLMSISPDLYEVADVEGAGWWQKLFYITLPLLAPTITINIVMTTVAILASFDLLQTLTAGGGPGYFGTTLAMLVYNEAYSKMRVGRSIAVATILSIISMIIAFFELKVLSKREEATQ